MTGSGSCGLWLRCADHRLTSEVPSGRIATDRFPESLLVLFKACSSLVIEAWALVISFRYSFSLVIKIQRGLCQSAIFDSLQKTFVSGLLWGQFQFL
jgi:hypothetical protein